MHKVTRQICTIVCQITKFMWAVETPQMHIQNSEIGKTTTAIFFTCMPNKIFSDNNNVSGSYYNCKYYMVTIS
jgi:hypothetical protein